MARSVALAISLSSLSLCSGAAWGAAPGPCLGECLAGSSLEVTGAEESGQTLNLVQSQAAKLTRGDAQEAGSTAAGAAGAAAGRKAARSARATAAAQRAEKSALWVIGIPVLCVVMVVLFNLFRSPSKLPPAEASLTDIRTQGLATSFKTEKLHVCETPMYSYQHRDSSFTKAGHLLKYDEVKATSMLALLHVSGTRFADKEMHKLLLFYWLVAAFVACAEAFEWDVSVGIDLSTDEHIQYFLTIRDDVSMVVSFILGTFVSMVVGRWWDVRNGCVGALWGAVDDLCLILGFHIPSVEDRPAKETVLRLCLLSFRLCYNQLLGAEKPEDLQAHVAAGLMTSEELEAIKDLDSKPQCVWAWIGAYLHSLADQGKIKYKDVMMPQLDALVAKGRGAIGGLFAYTDTQIPYPYVHLLTSMVILTNFVVAIKGGLMIGRNLDDNGEPFDSMMVLTEMCHVTLIPFFYHSFVKLGCELSNPVGKDFFDLPGYAYFIFMRNENMAFFRAAERTPKSLLQVKA